MNRKNPPPFPAPVLIDQTDVDLVDPRGAARAGDPPVAVVVDRASGRIIKVTLPEQAGRCSGVAANIHPELQPLDAAVVRRLERARAQSAGIIWRLTRFSLAKVP